MSENLGFVRQVCRRVWMTWFQDSSCDKKSKSALPVGPDSVDDDGDQLAINSRQRGGGFTFGRVNPLYYSGDIGFLSLTGTASTYWSLNVSGAPAIAVQGASVSVNNSTALAAFDTATNFITGPATDVQAIWAAVLGANVNPNQEGSFQFCIANRPRGYQSRTCLQRQCLGAITVFSDSTPQTPTWVFGIPFLGSGTLDQRLLRNASKSNGGRVCGTVDRSGWYRDIQFNNINGAWTIHSHYFKSNVHKPSSYYLFWPLRKEI
ncbi:hypothetical protein DFH07DRAFT_945802 [Mycena maculata]|uniref:Peptidase A1 domain-containing protein n=1 Tax=Mycena maculata TaxID=230809 RepID=A0AAD7HVC8_9AGAR|nr:hypothetical protein DFH07DRAFT_945802 [Mycena maculata]